MRSLPFPGIFTRFSWGSASRTRRSQPRSASRSGSLRLESLEQRLALAVYSAQEPTALFGTLSQHALAASYPQFGVGASSKACGPAAATNALVYLQNAFPKVYGSGLTLAAQSDVDGNGTVNAADGWTLTAGAGLAAPSYMNTTLTTGTWHDNFIRGVASYAESRLPGRTQYLAQDFWAPTYWGNAPTPKQQPDWVQGQAPTWNFLYDALSRNAAVNVLFSATTGNLGHYVTVTGLTWDTDANAGTLSYVNPWNGLNERTGIRTSGTGTLSTDYFGTNGSWVGLAEALVPVLTVPENSPADTTVALPTTTIATTYTLVQPPTVDTLATAWMPMSTFLTHCRGQDAARSFPLTIQGRVNPQNGGWECRGVFQPWIPSGVSYWYEFGRTKDFTDRVDAQRRAEGYSVLSRQSFLAAGNVPTYQTVWVREGLAPARQALAVLEPGAVPTDNAAFRIVAGQLKTVFSFDYEAKSSYSIRVRATQANGTSSDSTLVVSVMDVNEAPVVAGVATSGAAYAARSGPVRLAASATVADADAASFDGGSLSFALVSGGLASDRLTVVPQGTGSTQVGVAASTITFGGRTIGSWTGGTGTAPLVITFNGLATAQAVQAVMRSVAYASTAIDPTAAGTATTRTIRAVLSDRGQAAGGLTATVVQSLAVRA